MMRAVDIIGKKRDGGELTGEEIGFLVQGATDSSIPDYQLAAFLMAVVWRGMTNAELASLTEALDRRRRRQNIARDCARDCRSRPGCAARTQAHFRSDD
jgi:thymidine phosphorylase